MSKSVRHCMKRKARGTEFAERAGLEGGHGDAEWKTQMKDKQAAQIVNSGNVDVYRLPSGWAPLTIVRHLGILIYSRLMPGIVVFMHASVIIGCWMLEEQHSGRRANIEHDPVGHSFCCRKQNNSSIRGTSAPQTCPECRSCENISFQSDLLDVKSMLDSQTFTSTMLRTARITVLKNVDMLLPRDLLV